LPCFFSTLYRYSSFLPVFTFFLLSCICVRFLARGSLLLSILSTRPLGYCFIQYFRMHKPDLRSHTCIFEIVSSYYYFFEPVALIFTLLQLRHSSLLRTILPHLRCEISVHKLPDQSNQLHLAHC
jgi:hypothetical protein